MPDDDTRSPRKRLMAALEVADANRREARAERIEWLSLHRRLPAIYMGRTETMALLSEAADTFVDGHFVSAFLLATCFLEHTLLEELQDHQLGSDRTSLKQAIDLARQHTLFPSDWLDRLDAIREKRNPLAHLRPDSDASTMGNRFRAQKVHPKVMLESDAKDAMELMYEFFVATLRELDTGATTP